MLATGFLGAGKTSLINGLLAARPGLRAGVLVNDFGELAVDGSLIQRANPAAFKEAGLIYELAHGSIFCACLSAGFAAGLKYLAGLEPELLLVEASGLSDPSSLGRLLRESGLAGRFDTLVACVIDPFKFLRLLPNLEAVRRQAAAAGVLVLNKADIAPAGLLAETRAALAGINPTAPVLEAVFGRCGLERFLPACGDSGRHAHGPAVSGDLESCNTPGNRPASLLLSPAPLGREALAAVLRSLLGFVHRIKGYVRLDEGLFYVSDSNGSLVFESVEDGRTAQTGLVVLCDKADEARVLAAWEAAQGEGA